MLADQDDLLRIARMNGAKAPSVTFFTLGKAFAELRNSDGHEWLRELPYAVVRYTLKRQADAWRRFFDAANRPTQTTLRCQRPIAGPVPRIRSVPAPPPAQGHTDLAWNKRHGRNLPLAFVPSEACGHAANADVNAARNIMASGIGAAGRRGRWRWPPL